jgi:hypothetical protein
MCGVDEFARHSNTIDLKQLRGVPQRIVLDCHAICHSEADQSSATRNWRQII